MQSANGSQGHATPRREPIWRRAEPEFRENACLKVVQERSGRSEKDLLFWSWESSTNWEWLVFPGHKTATWKSRGMIQTTLQSSVGRTHAMIFSTGETRVSQPKTLSDLINGQDQLGEVIGSMRKQSSPWITTNRVIMQNQWVCQGQSESRRIFEELMMKSRLYQENHALNSLLIEELRRICREETVTARQLMKFVLKRKKTFFGESGLVAILDCRTTEFDANFKTRSWRSTCSRITSSSPGIAMEKDLDEDRRIRQHRPHDSLGIMTPGLVYITLEELILEIVWWKLRGGLSWNCIPRLRCYSVLKSQLQARMCVWVHQHLNSQRRGSMK